MCVCAYRHVGCSKSDINQYSTTSSSSSSSTSFSFVHSTGLVAVVTSSYVARASVAIVVGQWLAAAVARQRRTVPLRPAPVQASSASASISVSQSNSQIKLFICIITIIIIIIIRPRRSRSAAAYSRQTPVNDLSVARSVQCIVEKRWIGSGCRLA